MEEQEVVKEQGDCAFWGWNLQFSISSRIFQRDLKMCSKMYVWIGNFKYLWCSALGTVDYSWFHWFIHTVICFSSHKKMMWLKYVYWNEERITIYLNYSRVGYKIVFWVWSHSCLKIKQNNLICLCSIEKKVWKNIHTVMLNDFSYSSWPFVYFWAFLPWTIIL